MGEGGGATAIDSSAKARSVSFVSGNKNCTYISRICINGLYHYNKTIYGTSWNRNNACVAHDKKKVSGEFGVMQGVENPRSLRSDIVTAAANVSKKYSA